MRAVSILLRIGLAFSFLYAAVFSFIDPNSWSGFFPVFLQHIVPVTVLLPAFSVVEIVIALWLLWGQALFYSAIVAGLMLAGIVVFNFGAMDLLFRDVSLVFAAAALATIGYGERKG